MSLQGFAEEAVHLQPSAPEFPSFILWAGIQLHSRRILSLGPRAHVVLFRDGRQSRLPSDGGRRGVHGSADPTARLIGLD